MRRFAVSSWCLDGLLQSGFPLVELPGELARHGIGTFEICHFHLPSTDKDYVDSLRDALRAANIELFSVLIDAGDITASDPQQRERDVQMIREWMGIARDLGAERVRIDAGLQPPTAEVVQRSTEQLRELAQHGASLGLRVSIENWHATSLQPEPLLAILDGCDGLVGLCADVGNAEHSSDKYATLEQLLPRATSVHFKTRTTPDGQIDDTDLQRCVGMIDKAGFDGVITLIYDGKREEWAGIERLRQKLQPLLHV